MRTVKLLVLGGCHVVGHGLADPNDSFINIATSRCRKDGIEFDIKIIPNFLYKNYQTFIDLVNDFEPEVLILQLGNYEFTPVLSKELKRALQKEKKKVKPETKPQEIQANEVISHYVGPAMTSAKDYYSFQIKDMLKELANLIFPFSKRHSSRFYEDINTFIKALKSVNAPIIYISVLPTLGPFINRRRKLFNKEYLPLCNQENIALVDSHTAIPRKRTLFQDAIHLNREGHYRLAEHVYPLLRTGASTRIKESSELIGNSCSE